MTTANAKPHPYKRDLPAALRAVRALLRDPNDTAQVFVIMQSLNGPSAPINFDRLMRAEGGPRQAYRRVELAERLSDPAFICRISFKAIPPSTITPRIRTPHRM